MPSYQAVLDADPSAFASCGDEFDGAKADLASGRELYRSHVDRTDRAWEGDDHDRMRGEADEREGEFRGIEQTLGQRATVLSSLGTVMDVAVQTLKTTHQAIESAGYTVANTPEVSMGPSQEAQAASPPPAGPAFRTLYEVTAQMATILLKFMHRAVEVMDEVMNAALEAGKGSIADLESMVEQWAKIEDAGALVRHQLAADPEDAVSVEEAEDPTESAPAEADELPIAPAEPPGTAPADDARSTMLGRAAGRMMDRFRGGADAMRNFFTRERAGMAAIYIAELFGSQTTADIVDAQLPSPPVVSAPEVPGESGPPQVGPTPPPAPHTPAYPDTPPAYRDRREDSDDEMYNPHAPESYVNQPVDPEDEIADPNLPPA